MNKGNFFATLKLYLVSRCLAERSGREVKEVDIYILYLQPNLKPNMSPIVQVCWFWWDNNVNDTFEISPWTPADSPRRVLCGPVTDTADQRRILLGQN